MLTEKIARKTMNKLKYEYTEPGYCRVYYSWLNSKGEKCFYCAQEERKGLVVFYRCTDDWHEPAYEVKPKDAPELSPNSTEIDKAVNEWIENKWDAGEVPTIGNIL